MTDDSPTGPLRLFRPRAAAQFAWLLPLALAGLVLAWSDAWGPGAPASRRISAGVWTGWLVMYWIVLSFAGGLIHTYYVAVLGPPLAVFSGIAVAGLWSRWKAGKPGRIYLPLVIVATAAWQFYLCMAPSETIGSDWLSLTWLTSIGIAVICAGVLYALPQQGNRFGKTVRGRFHRRAARCADPDRRERRPEAPEHRGAGRQHDRLARAVGYRACGTCGHRGWTPPAKSSPAT